MSAQTFYDECAEAYKNADANDRKAIDYLRTCYANSFSPLDVFLREIYAGQNDMPDPIVLNPVVFGILLKTAVPTDEKILHVLATSKDLVRSTNAFRQLVNTDYDRNLVDVADSNGVTPFLLAIMNQNVILAQLLEMRGAKIHPHALHSAVTNDDVLSVRYLIQSGANPNALNLNAQTALFYVFQRTDIMYPESYQRSLEMIELLKGTNVSIKNRSGLTAVDYALKVHYGLVIWMITCGYGQEVMAQIPPGVDRDIALTIKHAIRK